MKVWMVWREVDFNQEWLEGVFASESLARKRQDELFEEYKNDRAGWDNLNQEEWDDRESPFSVSSAVVEGA